MTMNDLPRQLGPYRLLRRLGHGGMCEVFLAEVYGASGFEKKVAIKTLLPALKADALFERSLIREASIGARLHHQNIVQIHDFGVDQGTQYLRMDYVEGRDLGQLLARGPMSQPLAIYVVSQVALGLGYLHDYRDARERPLGLVHRDVSPSNILVSHHGEVKLTDFGILKATAWADVTRGNVRKGKYGYMAPEQLAGAPVSAATDVFSLGVVFAELLTGRRPFDGPNLLETIDRVKEARDPDLEGVPSVLLPLIERCLSREPEHRFRDGTALYRALRAQIGGHFMAGPLELRDMVVDRA